MRDIINLLEAEIATNEPVQDGKLSGSLNFDKLTSLLPAVDNPALLQSAVKKVMNGRQNTLNMKEAGSLAKAFISILSAEPNARVAIVRALNGVHTKE